MFSSVHNIVEFTIVQKASSRGFEPAAHYLLSAPSWTDPFMLLLIGYGWRKAPLPLRVWAVIPVVVLSLFPHKEERYLLPVLPFLVLIAGTGAWQLLSRARANPESRRALWAVFVLCGALLLEMEGFRFRRSEAAIDVARFLATRPGVHSVAMEEGTTTSGATLYLRPPMEVINIERGRLDEAAYLWAILTRPGAQYVVLRDGSLRPAYRDLLREAGYSKVPGPEPRRGEPLRIFVRGE